MTLPSPVKESVDLNQIWLERATARRYVIDFIGQHLDGHGPVIVGLLCVETGRTGFVELDDLLSGKWELMT